MKPIKIKLIKSKSNSKVNVSDEEEAKLNKTNHVKVKVLQNLSSLRAIAEEENLVFNMPLESEEEEPVPTPAVVRRSRRKSNRTETSASKVSPSASVSIKINQKKQLEKINEEWKKIEAAKEKLNDEKEKIEADRKEINEEKEMIEAGWKELNDEKVKTAEERSKLNEEKRQIDEEWGSLHEMKEKILRESEVQSIRTEKKDDDVAIVEEDDVHMAEDDDVTIVELSPEKPAGSERVSSDSVKKSSRKRKMSPEPVQESKKGRKEERVAAKTTPSLRLKDFSTLAEDFSSTKYENIEKIDVEDIKRRVMERKEKREMNKFQGEVLEFLAELYRKSSLPDDEQVLSSLGSKFSDESLESYILNHGTVIGISMSKEVKKSIVLKFFIFLEIRNTVVNTLNTSGKKFFETSSLSLEFLDKIIESKKVFDKKFSKDLTGDHKLWIANQIKFRGA